MFVKPSIVPARPRRAASQQGMVLLVALIVLVAVMVAGVAMMRSVDTATLVSGNLAFQRAATHATDRGVEGAIKMLMDKKAADNLDANDPTNGYFAQLRGLEDNPPAGKSWQEFWQASLASASYSVGDDGFGNQIAFVVHRACDEAKPANGTDCVASPVITSMITDDPENPSPYKAVTHIYYRITVRVSGPKRTESYVQTYVAL